MLCPFPVVDTLFKACFPLVRPISRSIHTVALHGRQASTSSKPGYSLVIPLFKPFPPTYVHLRQHKKNGHKGPKNTPHAAVIPSKSNIPPPPNQTPILGNVRSMFARCSILHFLFVPSHLPISPLNSHIHNIFRLCSEHSVHEHFVFPPIYREPA